MFAFLLRLVIIKNMKQVFSFLFETIKIAVVAFLIVLPIRYFLFQPFLVKGDSMLSNFSDGDYLLIDEISFRFREPQRGEVIVFSPPHNNSTRYIKRIIGLPGETIQIQAGQVMIAQQNNNFFVLDESKYLLDSFFTPGNVEITLGENEFFVLGDNRQFSSDSRSFGVLSREHIIGRVFFRAWPFNNFTKIEAPAY